MGRKFFVEVKKIVTTLNEAEVPSEDIVEVVESPPFVFLAFVKSFLRSDFHVVEYILQMSPMRLKSYCLCWGDSFATRIRIDSGCCCCTNKSNRRVSIKLGEHCFGL
ncbi:hypothetical protein L3X38_031060 [Prunus dulcis]|uniref:Uncharacterized protein n=1 Tax=Prunus dulcis TaxID=3755 RepID=A0AAD4VCH3_PRUDU|nr:hypothetical protein L3X38_031060 [Prunus dulcis]